MSVQTQMPPIGQFTAVQDVQASAIKELHVQKLSALPTT